MKHTTEEDEDNKIEDCWQVERVEVFEADWKKNRISCFNKKYEIEMREMKGRRKKKRNKQLELDQGRGFKDQGFKGDNR